MKNYRGSWFMIGVLVAVVAGLALAGCATTNDTSAYVRATLSPDEQEVMGVVEASWAARRAALDSDGAVRWRTIRNLKVETSGDTARVSYIIDILKTGSGGQRPWSGSIPVSLTLRKEGGVWKVVSDK